MKVVNFIKHLAAIFHREEYRCKKCADRAECERKKIDVYTYEDVNNEDYTRKFTLNVCDILTALAGEGEEA